jgi:SAM-dependent methyltransferase
MGADAARGGILVWRTTDDRARIDRALAEAYATFAPETARDVLLPVRDHHRQVFALVGMAARPEDEPIIVDAGCGAGMALVALRALGYRHLLGLDRFDEYDTDTGTRIGTIKQILERLESRKIPWHRCDLVEGELPVKDGSVDLVLFMDVVEHLHRPKAVLTKLARMLRPGGHLLLETPNLASLRNRAYLLFGRSTAGSEVEDWYHFERFWGHVREYTEDELRRMLDLAGFDTVACRRMKAPVRSRYARVPRPLRALGPMYSAIETVAPSLRYQLALLGRKRGGGGER